MCMYQFPVGNGDPTQRADVNDLAMDMGNVEFDEAHCSIVEILNLFSLNTTTLSRACTPNMSEPTTSRTRSRRESVQPIQPAPQAYWNEYDDGSEVEIDVHIIYVSPDAELTFPGAKTISFLFSKAMMPVEKVTGWLSHPSSPDKRRPLIGNGNGNVANGHFTEQAYPNLLVSLYSYLNLHCSKELYT